LLRRLRARRPGADSRILFLRPALPVEAVLALRGALVLALVFGVFAMFWFDREGLRDNLDGHVSTLDTLYFTMITITTVGYGDIVPVTDRARLLDAVIATPVRIFVWFIFLGTAYQLVIRRVIEDLRMTRLQKTLANHVVLCGYGESGRRAAQELRARNGEDEQLVVVERDEALVRAAADAGCLGLHGDATREDMLRLAAVSSARAVVVAVGRDDTALLCLLTVRALGSAARTIVSIREGENVKLVREAGADAVVSPWHLGGCLLADAVDQHHLVAFTHEMLGEGGATSLVERAVRPEETGRFARELPHTLVLSVRRGGRQIRFWEADGLRLEAGDVLVAVDAHVPGG
jgi:voltage-gated potassium channel